MSRGRLFVPVFGSRIRSSSVPAGYVSSYERTSVSDLEAARKANLIAHFAAEDSDAIAAASRRHDRDFLYDISNKLATVHTAHSPTRYHSPSPAPSAYYAPLPPAPKTVHRRPPPPPPTARRSLLTPEDNYDIASYLQWAPSRSVLPYSRSARSASVPPPSGTVLRPTVPRWFPTSPAYYGRRGGNYVPGVVPVGLPPLLPRGDRMDAMTDGVVGVAHTSLYGDIVIGIPYKKRFMFSAQNNGPNDFDTQSLPPMHLSVPTRVVSAGPHFAPHRQTPAASIGISKPYSRASYAAPPTAYQRQQLLTRPLSHYINDAADVYDDYDDIVSTKSRPPVSSARSKILKQELESDIANSIFGDEYTGPPRRSTLSKDYKAVLSRYSLPPPTTNGPRHVASSLPDPELDRKYEHVLASMQPLMSSSVSYGRAPAASGNYSSVVPPSNAYAAHSSSLPPPYAAPRSLKPAVSDTRRKLRDLLCRTRNDPHYFDD